MSHYSSRTHASSVADYPASRRSTIASEHSRKSRCLASQSMITVNDCVSTDTWAGLSEARLGTYSDGFKLQDDHQSVLKQSISEIGFSREAGGAQLALSHDDTLLTLDAAPAKSAAELKSLLGNNYSRLKPGEAVISHPSPSIPATAEAKFPTAALLLEQARPDARVKIGIFLTSDTCIQGNFLKGKISVQTLKCDELVWLAKGKIRIIGFECISDDVRHTFYECTVPLSTATSSMESIYASPADAEGFTEVKHGLHSFPFSVLLPDDDSCGKPRGVLQGVQSGAIVRYIAMVSFKVKSGSGERSIAHFYRNCEIWPRLDPSLALSNASRPLLAQVSKKLFFGGKGKISLSAQLHRLTWIAGQRCYIKFKVTNETKKTVKSLTLALIRTITTFKPHPQLDALPGCADPDACQTSTTRKKVAVSILEMGHTGEKGHASAKGWWTGIGPKQNMKFSHFILLPPDSLSFTRVRLLEVEYTIRITLNVGSLARGVQVDLPVRIINFLSVDPPPHSPLASPEAAPGRYFMRDSDQNREVNNDMGIQRVLLDGGFAGAPYSGQGIERAPLTSLCTSEQSLSVYDGSCENAQHPKTSWLEPYPIEEPGIIYATSERPIQNTGARDGYLSDSERKSGDPLVSDLPSSAVHSSAPCQPTTPLRRDHRTTPTAFDLLVQEKLRALAQGKSTTTMSVTKEPSISVGAAPENPTEFENSCLKVPSRTPITISKPPSRASPNFSLLPSYKLPRPPKMNARPVVRTRLTDPGPMPVAATHTIDESSAAVLSVFRRQSIVAPDVGRLRSQTLSTSHPSSSALVGSRFSVKSRVTDMEERVSELYQNTDGVVPFC